jgi:hypothetical protein
MFVLPHVINRLLTFSTKLFTKQYEHVYMAGTASVPGRCMGSCVKTCVNRQGMQMAQ